MLVCSEQSSMYFQIYDQHINLKNCTCFTKCWLIDSIQHIFWQKPSILKDIWPKDMALTEGRELCLATTVPGSAQSQLTPEEDLLIITQNAHYCNLRPHHSSIYNKSTFVVWIYASSNKKLGAQKTLQFFVWGPNKSGLSR